MANRLHIHLKSGHSYEMDVPDGFSLPTQITAMKAFGHFCNEVVYVPIESIDFVFVAPAGSETSPVNPITQGMTKQ